MDMGQLQILVLQWTVIFFVVTLYFKKPIVKLIKLLLNIKIPKLPKHPSKFRLKTYNNLEINIPCNINKNNHQIYLNGILLLQGTESACDYFLKDKKLTFFSLEERGHIVVVIQEKEDDNMVFTFSVNDLLEKTISERIGNPENTDLPTPDILGKFIKGEDEI